MHMFIGPSLCLSELLADILLFTNLWMPFLYVSLDACMVQTCMIPVMILDIMVLNDILLAWNPLDISLPALLLHEYKGVPNVWYSEVL